MMAMTFTEEKSDQVNKNTTANKQSRMYTLFPTKLTFKKLDCILKYKFTVTNQPVYNKSSCL